MKSTHPRRKYPNWEKAKSQLIDECWKKNGVIICSKCGMSCPNKRTGMFHVHDIELFCVMQERDKLSVEDFKENLVILCKFCHLVAPHNTPDDFKIWISQKEAPGGPLAARLMSDMELWKYDVISKEASQ